jgi:subtilisin family serine protease
MKLKHFSYLFLILFISNTGGVYSQTVNKDFFDGEIYVKYNDDFAIDFSNQFVEPQSLIGLNEELVKEYGITQARFSFNKIPDIKLQRTVRIKFTELEKVEGLIKHFEQLPYIEYAEKMYNSPVPYTPNDLGANLYNKAWYHYKIRSPQAWDITKGDSAIVVAVVDDEIDINHIDLKDNIWTNPNEIPNNGIDDDGNGYIDDIHGWDVSDNDNAVFNNVNIHLDHGTRSAGMIAAVTDNDTGVAGIGFNVSILPVKMSRDNITQRAHTHIYEGLAYAAIMNPDIINCSCGGPTNLQTYKNTVGFIINKGIPLIASAHNYDNTTPIYPAAYPGVISVAATDINDKKSSFSNYGSWVDITAPGEGLLNLQKNDRYAIYGGTSGAAPVVSGVASLIKSYMPTISKSDLEYCLLNYADTVDHLNTSYKGKLGSGRVNAERALQCVDSVKKSPPIISVTLNKNYICPLEKITLSATSYKRPLDSIIWYIYRKDTIEKLTGLQIETSFAKDSIYSISVVGYDKYGKDSIFLSQFINVNSTNSFYHFIENFEHDTPNIYTLNNSNKILWRKSVAPKTNNTSNEAIKLDYFNASFLWRGERNALITKSIDLRYTVNPYFTFQFAYSKLSTKHDSLNIYISTDSGLTFPYKIFSQDLATVSTGPNSYADFFPDNNSEWCTNHWRTKCPLISLSQFINKNNIVIKFESYFDGGNNLYIDDIKVYSNCGDAIYSKPKSSFTSADTVVCLDDSLQFSATSTSFLETYQWVFEGGISNSTNSANPKVLYKDTGSFDVTLISSNVLGADTLVLKDYITVLALPKVTVSDTLKYVCPKDSVFFTAWGTDSIVWQNTNTNKITIDSVIGDRPIQNTFYQAKAITKEGCFDTKTVEAILVPIPPAITLTQVIDSLRALHTSGNFSYRWYINDTFTNLYTTRTIKPHKTANYKVEIIDSAGCSSITNNFFVSTIGISQLSLKGIKIYPNPASSELYINGVQPNSTITVIDILGKEVYTSTINGTSTTISISSFSKGLYLIKISQGEQSIIKKIIVE